MSAHRPLAAIPAGQDSSGNGHGELTPAHAGAEPTQAADDTTAEGRRERHRRDTFERLVRAARVIMFNRGLSDVTVQEITDAADVGKGTFFNYFPSKGHVFSRLAEFNRRGLVRTVERVREGTRSSEEGLVDLLVWLMCPSTGEWLTYENNTVSALATQPDVRRSFSDQLRAGLPQVEELVSLGQERGTIRHDLSRADLSAMTIHFMAGRQILHWIHNVAPTPESLASQVKDYFTLLASPARTPGKPGAAPARPRAAKPRAKARSSARVRPTARPAVTTKRRRRS